MCPPNVADLTLGDNLARTAGAFRRAVRATVLDYRARWHWWRLESCDAGTVKHTRALGQVQVQTAELLRQHQEQFGQDLMETLR